MAGGIVVLKASDWIVRFLATQGVRHVFGVTGAHILHLVDSICNHPDLTFTACGHEQAAAFAAEAYGRMTGQPGVCVSTSGPGAVNLLSGICSAYFDNIPMLVFTGQVVTGQLKGSRQMRQLGFQETPVIDIFRPVTKAVYQPQAASEISSIMARAWLQTADHPAGPILVDLPDDVQRQHISDFYTYLNSGTTAYYLALPQDTLWQPLEQAKAPILILGAGVHQAQVEAAIHEMVGELGVPVLTTWGAKDILPWDHPYNRGTFGTCGPLAGNHILNEADLVIVLGARLNAQEIDWSQFDPEKFIIVDNNEVELAKHPKGVSTHLLDLRVAIDALSSIPKGHQPWYEWLAITREWYEMEQPQDKGPDGIGPYWLMRTLSEAVPDNAVIITDAGATLVWTAQAWRIKQGQRLFSSWNHSPMGYALPAAIGAARAAPDRPIIILCGDGSLQMNVQELGTLQRHKLNVKIIVLDNGGYGIIRQTQNTWLDGRHYASDEAGGLPRWFPADIAKAYRLPAWEAREKGDVAPSMSSILSTDGPGLLNLKLSPSACIVHKTGRSRNLLELEGM